MPVKRAGLVGMEAAMEVGWIGVGNMGRPMIEKLIDAGHDLVLYDLDDRAYALLGERSFRRVQSPRAVADACEVVFFCLPSPSAIRAAVLGPEGVLAGCRVAVLANSSTCGTELVDEIVAAGMEQGVRLVDCPISGGPEAARKAVLSVMVSGASDDVERLRPLLKTFAAKITVAGDRPGAAQILKLVNNLIILSAYVGTLEAVVLGAKAGLDVETMLEAINAGLLAPNGTTRTWLPDYILKGREFGGKLGMMVKDMDAALAEAHRFGVPAWVSEVTGVVARHAVHAGLGERDIIALAELIEEAAGIRLPREPDV
jgi:2-hydroxy-3-oxopropionate reductase